MANGACDSGDGGLTTPIGDSPAREGWQQVQTMDGMLLPMIGDEPTASQPVAHLAYWVSGAARLLARVSAKRGRKERRRQVIR